MTKRAERYLKAAVILGSLALLLKVAALVIRFIK